jgi:hypothetical protein
LFPISGTKAEVVDVHFVLDGDIAPLISRAVVEGSKGGDVPSTQSRGRFRNPNQHH